MILVIAATVVSAALFYFGTGTHPVWWLMWLAPIPVLLVVPRVRGRVAYAMAAFAWFAGTLNMWSYLRHVVVLPGNPHANLLVMPPIILVGVFVIPSLVFGLAVLLWRAFVIWNDPWRAALVVPAVWVTYEYLVGVTSAHGTFGNLVYTQMNFLPVLQLASVFGVWGVTFCVLFFAAAVAALLSGAGTAGQRQMFAAAAGLLMLVMLTFGWWRVHFMPEPEHSVTVGLLASDLPQNAEVADPDEDKGRLLRDYLEQVGLLAAQGARVIVLPEKLSAVVDPQITSETDALFQGAATKYKCSIVVGVLRRSGNDRLNEARMYRPAHPAVVTYDKQHMLPPFESNLRPGTTRALVSEPSGMWGVAICKDMDFPLLSRQYGKDGAGLLLVPAWDFGVDAWLHDRMAVMRGVESGFSIARAAKDGLLTVSDSRGQILAQQSSASAPFASAVAAVPVRNIATLYSRFGDWFAWLNIALLGMLLGSRLKRAG